MIVIGVDVGTTSVRLALVSFDHDNAQEATVLASHKKNISSHQHGFRFEQSSSEIWAAICECSKNCIKKANIEATQIKGIAFSATCSLVIESDQEDEFDIIMWADHRAVEEAIKITESKSKVLEQFGGVCSPEFSLAKLVWLHENDKNRFNSSKALFELPDWLVYRCVSDSRESRAQIPRSLCSVACKWGYNVDDSRHCNIIESLGPNISTKIGESVLEPGTISGYLGERAAKELGLLSNQKHVSEDKENLRNFNFKITVGTSLIDAHSGMLAMLALLSSQSQKNLLDKQDLESTICILAGTSSCMMSLSRERRFTKGVWGPYKNVILNGYYLLEAGQSMTGKLIEICIENHVEGMQRLQKKPIYEIIGELNEEVSNVRVEGLHVLPTYHGNRSPIANPRLRGGIYGLSADNKNQGLLEHYVATVESLVYEARLIVEALGTSLNTILLSGGLMKNEFYVQTLANALKCRVVTMCLEGVDFMVMGSSLVARHAVLTNTSSSKERHIGLTDTSISGLNYRQLMAKVYAPDLKSLEYHEKKYACYKEFVDLSIRIDKIMNN